MFYVSGCSSLIPQFFEPEEFKLLPPDQGPEAVLLKQTVTMEALGEQHQVLSVVRLEQEQVIMVALLPTGQQLLSITYDGEKLTQENYSPLAIPGEEILAIMQLALWPEPSIEEHYPESEGWFLEFSPGERKLRSASKTLLKINYQDDGLIIGNYLHNYRIIIHTLEEKVL